jgi:hypothetical protein
MLPEIAFASGSGDRRIVNRLIHPCRRLLLIRLFQPVAPEGHILCGWRHNPHTWAFPETTG